MKKYTFKNDFKNISTALYSFLSVMFIFGLFSAFLLFPIYYLSKQYTSYYSIVVLSAMGVLVIFFVIKKLFKTYKKYGKLNLLFLSVFVNLFIPVFIIVFIFFSEALAIKIFYEAFSYTTATALLILTNILIIVGLFFLRKATLSAKQKLTKL